LSRPEDTAADEGGEQSELVFYRCPTPTDFLCPCGAVARRLRKLDLPHRTERVPYRRTDRPEIIELTGQKRVPPPIPLLAIVLNQLTSSQTIRAMLVLFSTVTMLVMVIQGREVPDPVIAILFIVIGYYFGEAVPRPTKP
jgi:hypothetical protein